MTLSLKKGLIIQSSRSSRNFGEDLEDPRSDRIYSSGNRGVKKGPGPRGSRDEEFLCHPYLKPKAHLEIVFL